MITAEKKMYLCCDSRCFLNLFITNSENWINIQDNTTQQNILSVFFAVCSNSASWNSKCVLMLSYYRRCFCESNSAY